MMKSTTASHFDLVPFRLLLVLALSQSDLTETFGEPRLFFAGFALPTLDVNERLQGYLPYKKTPSPGTLQ